MFYPLRSPDGTEIYPIAPEGYESRWRCGPKKYAELESNNLIEWIKVKKSGKEVWQVYQKFYLEGRLKQPSNLWKDVEGNKKATRDLKDLFDGKKIFDFPKPTELIQKIIQLISDDNSIILDFFAGSGTTAHAVMKQNYNDKLNRKYICIQMPEPISKNTVAYVEGYLTVADIAKERIRRVIKQIKEQNKQQKLTTTQDLGFKVFKLTKSNYKQWESPEDTTKLKSQLKLFENPLIENYKDLDIVYEIIIKEGYSLNSKIEKLDIKTNTIYKVSDQEFFFFVCLDKQVKQSSIESLKLDTTVMFVCLDSELDDSQKSNLSKMCNLRTI
jgi:adenine-specific DNA-methyltransferase